MINRLISRYSKTIVIGLFLLAVSLKNYAQENEVIKQQAAIPVSLNSEVSIQLPFDGYPMNKKIKKGVVIVSLDAGAEFISDPTVPFSASVKISIEAKKDNSVVNNLLDEVQITLQIDQSNPETHHIISIIDHVSTINGNDNFELDELKIKVTEVTLPGGYYGSAIRLLASSEVHLGLNVASLQSESFAVEVNNENLVSEKVANFKWSDTHPVTNYQIQVLRLYNNSVNTAANEQTITATIDWTKAMTFEGKASFDSENNKKFFTLTIAEGTGYYVFRVRPIGSYYEGGIADNRNWGIWSTHDPQDVTKNLALNTVEMPYFYFTDPDQNRNWIYNRTFIENGKVKEGISYANGLSQTRQTQAYLPSQNITLVTQTILDHSGRPSVTTIPVPLAGRVSKYQENFVKASGSEELYKAKHFDTDANVNNPQPIVSSPYYNNNEDKSIPNDNGYGFTRTIFYNEAGARVREQSGVGETHKIGGGRTTQYLYSTPTEDELIALFGDEAPASESVMKTITIDPNKIASVTYTSKEGKIIATSLGFREGIVNNLDELNEPANTVTVQDKIIKNSKIGNGFVSSKRISLIEQADFQVSYSIECLEFEQLCQVAAIDCKYQLTVSLLTLDEAGNVASREPLISKNLSEVVCQNVEGKEIKLVNMENPIILGAGNYIIEKRLIAGDPYISIGENSETINMQVRPITDLVSGWLELVENEVMLQEFNKSLYNLAQAMNNQTLANNQHPKFPVNLPDAFYEDVYDDFKAEYQLTFQPADYDPNQPNAGNPIAFTLKTICCIINVPVKWVPPFDCTTSAPIDKNNDGTLEVKNYFQTYNNPNLREFFPDFEGYALAYLSECIGPELDYATEQDLKETIYGIYMDGWEIEGTFNMMVYHMLTDEYNTNNTADGQVEEKTQYTCDQLISCWISQLNQLKNEICVKFNFQQGAGKTNVSSAFDTQYSENTDPKNKNHNSHFDDNFNPKGFMRLIKWIIKKKVSKRMRGLQLDQEEGGEEIQPELGQFHLVKSFLECTNYQFAKIITPFDAKPLDNDVHNGFNNQYAKPINNIVGLQINHDITKIAYFGGNPAKLLINGGYNYKYIPLSDWDPRKKIKNPNAGNLQPTDNGYFMDSNESLFPNIKNPIYAFKYFEYSNEGKSTTQNLEAEVCYSDPNDCYQIENGKIKTINGQPVKIPCCSATPAWNDPGCYADTEYPGLNENMVGYALNGQNAPAKLVVRDFCEKGRVICPYTKDAWSSGQRLTFFSMLKNYVPPSDDWKQTLDNYDLTCQDLTTPHKWYSFTGDSELLQDALPDLVHEGMPLPISMLLFNTLYTPIKLNDGVTTTFKYIQLEIEDILSDCNTTCDNRRSEFRNKLVAMLEKKCYDIGGCFVSVQETPHVVPEEDLNEIVEAMVQACKSQCKLTTYSCETISCRSMDKPYTEVGAPNSEFRLSYGMGGFDPNFCLNPENYNYTDDVNCAAPDNTGLRQCTTTNPNNGSINNLSWYEYTKLKQVSEWDFDVDMPNMCPNAPPSEDDINCVGCVPPDPNTYAGDTFVPKTDYEVRATKAPNSISPTVGDPVKSPPVGINVKIDPNN